MLFPEAFLTASRQYVAQLNKLSLDELELKMSIWDILYRDNRGKNAQTLADLEIRPIDRKRAIEGLTVNDYCQGPLEEKLYGGAEMWVFGKVVKSMKST